MNFKLKFALFVYIVNVIAFFAIGLSFELRTEFFSFHSDVIETAWNDVDAQSQILYLGMMRTEGAGYLASGVALAILLYIPFRKYEKWSYWAMTVIGTVEHLPTLLATYHVSSVTNASPPWLLSLLLILSLFLALGLSIIGHRERALDCGVGGAGT